MLPKRYSSIGLPPAPSVQNLENMWRKVALNSLMAHYQSFFGPLDSDAEQFFTYHLTAHRLAGRGGVHCKQVCSWLPGQASF